MSKIPLTIHLGQELWSNELVAELTRLGHNIILLPTDFNTVYLSRHAWRVPSSIGVIEILPHVEMIIKQVRLLINEDQATHNSKEAHPKPRRAARRKQAAEKVTQATGSTGDPSDTPGIESPPTSNEKVRKKRAKKNTEETQAGC